MATLTIDQAIDKLTELQADVNDMVLAAMNVAGLDAIDIIKDRVIRGQKTDGSEFSDYSEEYAEFRESKGRSTSPKNFDFTAQMINSIFVEDSITDSEVKVTIRAGDQIRESGATNDELMEYHELAEGEGSIINLNPQELAQVQETFNDEIEKRFIDF